MASSPGNPSMMPNSTASRFKPRSAKSPNRLAHKSARSRSPISKATRFMRTANGFAPAYNVQTAVDTEHALIVAQKVTDEATDNRSLWPMGEAAKQAVGDPPSLNLVAEAGYSNGEQAETCDAQGFVLHVPAQRAVNNQGDGTLFDRREFHYDEKTDTFRCPANQTLTRKQLQRHKTRVIYAGDAEVCGACAMKSRCTNAPATVRAPSSSRWGFAAHAAARDPGDDAVARIDRGTSVRIAQVPHLRKSTFPAPWSARRASGDQPGHHGLQLEAHAECAGCQPAPSGSGRITEPSDARRTELKQKSDVRGFRTSLFLAS